MNRYKQVVTIIQGMDTNTIVELPQEYWTVIRQVLENSLTAKGSEGAKMLHEIFSAFDEAGIELPEPQPEPQPESLV